MHIIDPSGTSITYTTSKEQNYGDLSVEFTPQEAGKFHIIYLLFKFFKFRFKQKAHMIYD